MDSMDFLKIFEITYKNVLFKPVAFQKPQQRAEQGSRASHAEPRQHPAPGAGEEQECGEHG